MSWILQSDWQLIISVRPLVFLLLSLHDGASRWETLREELNFNVMKKKNDEM